jgi:type IV pilus assembly protein PilA
MAVPRRLRRAPRPEDEGFTLIELLVVIIIIGILAAIAIPVYLNQRTKAVDAGAKQDLRVLATFQETYLTNSASYADFAQLDADGEVMLPTKNDTVTIVRYSQQAYCLSAKGAGSPRTWYYDSQAGGIQPLGSTGCPVTTAGNAGTSRTG